MGVNSDNNFLDKNLQIWVIALPLTLFTGLLTPLVADFQMIGIVINILLIMCKVNNFLGENQPKMYINPLKTR